MSTIANQQRVRLGQSSKLKYLFGALAAVAAAVLTFAAVRALTSPSARYWVVTDNVPANVSLASVELKPVELSLGASSPAYLSGNERPQGFTSSPMLAGQILGADSVVTESNADLVRVVLTSSSPISSALHSGSKVAVWAAQKLGADFGPVQLLIADAQVVKIVQPSSTPFSSASQQVEVQLSQLVLPAVLDSLATESAIYLVAQS